MRRSILLAACLVLVLGQAGFAQSKKAPKKAPKKAASVISLTAEDLVKECKADEEKATAKYENKVMRVTGVVGSIYDDILYLPVQLKPGESSIDVGFRFDKANKPTVKTGDKATLEGNFQRVGALGPYLTEGKLVKDEEPAGEPKTKKKGK